MEYGYILHCTDGSMSAIWGFKTAEDAANDAKDCKLLLGAGFDYAEVVASVEFDIID